ncbi:hypothetical protein [Rhodovulum euryhalinum]|uniref:Uncharacterized protein n=1 Tax=Rhodovulum euryhalinum TaxID=35805 RepID=A0A4R2K8R0_9RHOB|nr:hypothetical protein [Rhodovulum euryhalinum]TCO69763.1 hypothetical protein EV655_11349 [Rhodovulum euryhalinum]
MITDLANAMSRCRRTLWQDALGAAALMVTLFAGLHLPALF